MKRYDVRIERDESGAWLASVPAVPGCHTYGRSIAQALNRAREALGLWVHDVDNVELVPHVQLPADLRQLAGLLERAREEERQAHEETQEVLLETLRRAVIASHLSIRDAAVVVGLSPQRVQQLIDRERKASHVRRRAAAKRARSAGASAKRR